MMISMNDGDAWEQNQGRLTRAERSLYALSAVKAKLAFYYRALNFGKRRAFNRIDFDKIVYPDSVFARTAMEKMESDSSIALVNHCHRSYIWASLLGQLDGSCWDPEILYASMMLHDLGLTEKHHGGCVNATCFTFDGVQGAEDVLGLTNEKNAKKISDAILIHLNMDIPGEECGWEAHYLQAGSSLDVVGNRFSDMPIGCVNSTLERYPRLNLKEELTGWVDKESTLRPESRFSTLRTLGIKRMIHNNPVGEYV